MIRPGQYYRGPEAHARVLEVTRLQIVYLDFATGRRVWALVSDFKSQYKLVRER